MTKVQHTPGPWNWGEGVGEQPVGALYGATGLICDFGDATPYYPAEGTPPNEADKALIEAAPDLLNALENLAIAVAMDWELDGVLEVSSAAIAKARREA